MKKISVMTAVAILLLVAMAWGGMFPVAKATLSAVDAYYLTSIRYPLTSLIFVALLLAIEGTTALRLEHKGGRLLVLGALGFAGFGLLAFIGLARSRPEHGAIIMATQPLIGAMLIWVARGTRPAAVTLASIAVALGGVLLVITRGHVTGIFSGDTGLGDLLMLIGAISWVMYTLGAGGFPGWSPLRYTALTCFLAMPVIFGITAVATWTGAAHTPEIETLAAVGWQLVYIILIASVVGVLGWNIGNKVLGSSNGMLFINFVPITAFAIEIAQGHHFEAIELVGAAMVIGALVTNTLLMRTPGPAPDQPLGHGVTPVCPAAARSGAALQTGRD